MRRWCFNLELIIANRGAGINAYRIECETHGCDWVGLPAPLSSGSRRWWAKAGASVRAGPPSSGTPPTARGQLFGTIAGAAWPGAVERARAIIAAPLAFRALTLSLIAGASGAGCRVPPARCGRGPACSSRPAARRPRGPSPGSSRRRRPWAARAGAASTPGAGSGPRVWPASTKPSAQDRRPRPGKPPFCCATASNLRG